MKRIGLVSIFVLAIFALFVTCNDPAGGTPDDVFYTVTFDKNGGETEADPQTMTVTPPATTVGELPTAPGRENYEFTGWNTDSEGAGEEFTETTAVTADITVYAQWELALEEGKFIIEFELVGNVEGDSVSASPEIGEDGDTITISYTLADNKLNNRLAFTGTETSLGEVDEAGTGTKQYTVNEEDADLEGVITIIATFTHTDKEIDTIAFTNGVVNKIYGDAKFTETASAGQGSGAITYSSGHTDIATVDASTGEVTIVKVGSTTITATKAADDIYDGISTSYALHIAALQLTIGAPTGTTTKTYDGTTTATGITAGALANKVGADDVTVTVTSAVYNSANVADANKITVTYSISGAAAGNYIKPVDSEITTGVSITKAAGATVAAPTADTITHGHIAVHAVAAPNNGQTVEYAILETTTEPTENWQDAVTFTGLTGQTDYYVFARAKANANYNAGTAAVSEKITTHKEPDPGAALTGPVTVYQLRHNSVRINPITLPAEAEQTVEYSVTVTSGTPIWQDSPIFTGLLPATEYTASARSKANVDYLAGDAISSTPFTTKVAPTNPVPPTIVDFEDDITLDVTPSNNGTATATRVDDPFNDGEQSLRVYSTGYNRAAIVPINLPFALEKYESFTFRFYRDGGTTSSPILVYITDLKSKFVSNGFGNTSGTHFSNLKLGEVTGYSTTKQWVDYKIDINNPGDDIKNLSGDLYLAIGIHTNDTITLMFDDLTFTIKDDFEPSSIISPTTAKFVTTTTSALYADIPVTMTLYGNTLEGIKNGETTIQPGSSTYTVSGNEVTLKKEYLASLLIDPATLTDVTLTFEFNKGEIQTRNIVITIADIDANLPFTSWDFTTDPGSSGWRVEPSPNTTISVAWNTDTQRLRVTHSNWPTAYVVIPFNLGNKSLADYSSITIKIRTGGNDPNNKPLIVDVLRNDDADGVFNPYTNGTSNNLRIISQNNYIGGTGSNWHETPITLTSAIKATIGHLTGKIGIGFMVHIGNNAYWEIESVTLNE